MQNKQQQLLKMFVEAFTKALEEKNHLLSKPIWLCNDLHGKEVITSSKVLEKLEFFRIQDFLKNSLSEFSISVGEMYKVGHYRNFHPHNISLKFDNPKDKKEYQTLHKQVFSSQLASV